MINESMIQYMKLRTVVQQTKDIIKHREKNIHKKYDCNDMTIWRQYYSDDDDAKKLA